MTWREHLTISRRSLKLLCALSRRRVISAVLGSLVDALLPYVPVYFSARLIDALAQRAPMRTVWTYAALLAGLTALLGALSAWIRAQRQIGDRKLWMRREWMYAEKAMQLPCDAIEDHQTALMRERTRVESQTGYNLYYLLLCLEDVTRCAVQIAAAAILMLPLLLGGSLTAAAKAAFAGGAALSILLTIWSRRSVERRKEPFYASCVKENALLNRYMDYYMHYATGMDVRLYAMEEPLARFAQEELYGRLCEREAALNLRCAGLELIAAAASYALRLGIYLLLIRAALAGRLSVGSIAQYASCAALLLGASARLAGALQLSWTNHGYLKRFFAYFDLPNPMYQGSLSVEKREDNRYDVELRDVSFKYPNTDAWALRHVSLRFRVGERLAVVGMNGSGKTTLIKLLCRLYDPTEGEILLGGVDIRKYDYDEYLALFSVVFQDFRLFSFSLGQNVAAGVQYDRERAAACLREAGLGDWLKKLPNGLDSMLYRDFDKEGVEVSGGEAQKIALARALYKDAPFIVLDEPTAALDPESEYEVYRRFSEIAAGKNAVYISHRLASCRFCDEILVFHEGRIVQRGTHQALLSEPGGKYAELWHAQAQYYAASGARED